MGPKVGFIGGGQMAKALAGGALAKGALQEESLVFAVPSAKGQEALRTRFPAATVVGSGEELMPLCQSIVLAVKPHVLRSLFASLKPLVKPEQLFVSIASGISLANLKDALGTDRVIRVMPNTPSLVGTGASAVAADSDIAADDIAWVTTLLESVGIVERIPDSQMHAVTAVSGSGPAYVYLMIEAMSDGGVAQGLPRQVATRMAAQTLLGAAQMVLQTELHPGVLKDQVTSPGGTTIAAIRSLESAGFRSALIEAVAAAAQRSQELA
ncbi:pyrroline-5-carboxylate reductase [Aureliella helgolandensis]|uniref:Pyrroline-5-carboxylate reductase n=1 Tax=Aureliella helgolandensis TaxID=2527968 RepID=A0A518G8E7_9BACT|nr:pyrroline-5-carboxylate reductase [Aureliella helgolandensis]QDV24861.1 Pyrroline-5-carboxylate reductase [Aureliella helgolandensis]